MPLDLLRLARTTKDFRNLLMSRSSISLWKDVLRNIPGLPECPPWMSEPAWVNLVFYPHCHVGLNLAFGPSKTPFTFPSSVGHVHPILNGDSEHEFVANAQKNGCPFLKNSRILIKSSPLV